MGWSIRAFSASIANSAALQLVALVSDRAGSANADNTMRVTTEHILFGAFAFATNLTRARLTSASLRRFNPFDIRPLANAGAGAGAQAQIFLSPRSGFVLDVGESLEADATQNSAGAQQATIIVFSSTGDIAPVEPRSNCVRCASATTLVANAWTLCPLTFSDGLPNHRCRIVGARAESAGILAFRIIVPGAGYFPGGIGCQAATALDPPLHRDGGLGSWIDFDPNFPPQIEVFSTSADTAETFWLDIVDAGPSPS